MARNKFDVDESLESPFDAGHLKRTLHYIGRHKWKMLLALLLSSCASIAGLFSPKITEHVLNVIVPDKAADQLGWIQHMNGLRLQAEEIVLSELIHA